MWPGITPAMKKMVLRIQSMPGPATINTDMGGPRLLVGVGGKRVGGGGVQNMLIVKITIRSIIIASILKEF